VRYWFYEATEGLAQADNHRAIAESLGGVALMVEVLCRRTSTHQSGDFIEGMAFKASAMTIVMMLGQIDEHLEYLKGSAAWKGQLVELGTNFRASYGGEVRVLRDVVVHLAAHAVEAWDFHHERKDWWYPGPDILFNETDGIVGITAFGRHYDVKRVIRDARALAPQLR
jgi:hypothetical protein